MIFYLFSARRTAGVKQATAAPLRRYLRTCHPPLRESHVVLLGELGEEYHSCFRKRSRYSLDQIVSKYFKTVGRKTKESVLIVFTLDYFE